MSISKVLALLMIYLVISLTFFSAWVFASIYKAEGYGQDEASGTIRATDTLTVRTESILQCMVKADFTNDSYQAMDCGLGTPVVCIYSHPVSNVTGMLTSTVKEDSSGETQDLEVYVDNLPPTITTLTPTSLGGSVKAMYIIKDEANEYYTGKCSGFREIKLLLNGQVVNTTSHEPGLCSVNSYITGTLTDYEGKVNTSLIITDYVGLSANKTGSQVNIEAIPPVINHNIELFKPGTDNEIPGVSTNSSLVIDVDVKVEIQEKNLPTTGSVFANLSELDKTHSQDQSNIGATCEKIEDQKYVCTFSNIKLSPASGTVNVNIRATDSAGTSSEETITTSFTVINEAGTVTRLGPSTEKCTGDKCYLKTGLNEIIGDISTTSSYYDSNVKIEGADASCSYDNVSWLCKAEISGKSGFLELTGYDDLGNIIQGISELAMILDSQAPVKLGEINTTPDCPTSSDTLIININVTETLSPEVIIKADPSEISAENETSASCTQSGTTSWKCSLSISSIKDETINTNLEIIVQDFAGNQLKETIPISICIAVETTPDVIDSITPSRTLPRIDKKVASKVPFKVAIPLNIVIQSNAEILERSMLDCSATPGAGAAYMLNEEDLNPIMIIPLTYAVEWDEDDVVNVNCTQEFMIRSGNILYTQSESEIIAFELEAYNQPLGTLSEAYEDKVDDIKDRLKEVDNTIDGYKGIHDILGTFCKLAEGIGKINALLQTLKSALWGICIGLNAYAGLGDKLWKVVTTILTTEQNFVDSNIWPQGWVPLSGPTGSNTIGLVIKGTCSVYTCKFYDMNTWADIAISYATHHEQEKAKAAGKSTVTKTTETDGSTTTTTTTGDGETTITNTKSDGSQTTAVMDNKGNIISNEVINKDRVKITSNIWDPGTGNLVRSTIIDPTTGVTTTYTYENGVISEIEEVGGSEYSWETDDGFSDEELQQIKELEESEQILNEIKIKPIPKPENPVLTDVWKNLETKLEDSVFSNLESDVHIYQMLNNPLYISQGEGAGGVIYSDSVTGNVIAEPDSITGYSIFSLSILGGAKASNTYQNAFDINVRMGNAVDAFLDDDGTWVYNPFKSRHYDSLCMPAILFNARKERQILCKRLSCFEEMASSGGPLEACEFDYDLGMCLYVESARYKLEGPANFGSIMKNIGKAFFSNLFGTGILLAYLFIFPGCVRHQMDYTVVKLSATSVGTGWKCVACGVTGSLLSIKEVIAFIDNPYNPLSERGAPADIPSDAEDFCSEVDYDDED